MIMPAKAISNINDIPRHSYHGVTTSVDLEVVIRDIIYHFHPFLDQLIGHYSSLWGIMPDYHVECPVSSFLYVNGT